MWLLLCFLSFRKPCKHQNVRCLHGEEMRETAREWFRPSFARVRCLDCGKALYNVEPPAICYQTKTRHYEIPRKQSYTSLSPSTLRRESRLNESRWASIEVFS